MSRTVTATAAVLALVVLSALTSTAFAQSDDNEPSTSDVIEMQLIDQSFDLASNGDIVLTYRLTGDLATVAQLTPPTTTTTTTAPPTTAPPAPEPLPAETPAPLDPNAPPAPSPTTADPAATAPPTTVPPPPVPVVARVVNYEPLDRASELNGILGPSPRLANRTEVDGVLIDARATTTVNDDGTGVLTLTVPTDRDPSIEERLKFTDAGIHPILVELVVADDVVARHGTVVEFRTGANAPPPISLSLLAAIEAPRPTVASTVVAERVAQLEDIANVAEQIDAPLTLDVPPAIATAAALAGTGNELADQLADELLLSAPATPFDLSSATEIGRVDAFVSQLVEGEQQLRAALPRVEVGRDLWLATEPLSGAAAQELRDLGVQYLAMPTSLFESIVAPSPSDEITARDRLIDLTLPNGAIMPVLLLDDELGAAFTADATDEILEEQTPTEWSIETIAELRMSQHDAPAAERREGRGHLIATPDLTAPDPRLITELERIADATNAIEFVPAGLLTSAIGTQTIGDELRLPERAGPSLAGRLERITATAAVVANATSMLPDDDTRPVSWKSRLDSLISTAYTDAEADDVLDELTSQARTITTAVIAPEPFTFTLTGRADDIELRITNSLATPLDVVLRLTSPRLSFPEGDRLVTLAPSGSTAVPVSVVARSNGTSPVRVEILSPDGAALIAPVTLTARVTALTGIAQVITGAFVLILVTWWFSNWRSRRRELGTGDQPPTE